MSYVEGLSENHKQEKITGKENAFVDVTSTRRRDAHA